MDKNCTDFENQCKTPREAFAGRAQERVGAGDPLPRLSLGLGGARWPPTPRTLPPRPRQGWVTALPPPLLRQGLFPGPRAGPPSRFPHSPAASFRPGAHMALGRHAPRSPIPAHVGNSPPLYASPVTSVGRHLCLCDRRHRVTATCAELRGDKYENTDPSPRMSRRYLPEFQESLDEKKIIMLPSLGRLAVRTPSQRNATFEKHVC